jgi:hypothetical protein
MASVRNELSDLANAADVDPNMISAATIVEYLNMAEPPR